MIEGTDLKAEQHRRYLRTALRQTEENINGLKGQLKLLEDYRLWLANELEITEQAAKDIET